MSTLPERVRSWTPPILITLALSCAALLALDPAVGDIALSALMAWALFQSARFIWRYKPHNPNRHGRAGRHLLAMSYALCAVLAVLFAPDAWAGVGALFFGDDWDLPARAQQGMYLAAAAYLAFATTERNVLLTWERKNRKPQPGETRRVDHI